MNKKYVVLLFSSNTCNNQFILPCAVLYICINEFPLVSPLGGAQTVPFSQMKLSLIVAKLSDDILQILYYVENMVLNASICGSAVS